MYIAKPPLSDFKGTEEKIHVVAIEVIYEVEGKTSLFARARICNNIKVEGAEGPVFFFFFFLDNSDIPLLQRIENSQNSLILDTGSIQSPVSVIKSIVDDRKNYLIWPKMCLNSKVILKNPPFTFSLT